MLPAASAGVDKIEAANVATAAKPGTPVAWEPTDDDNDDVLEVFALQGKHLCIYSGCNFTCLEALSVPMLAASLGWLASTCTMAGTDDHEESGCV